MDDKFIVVVSDRDDAKRGEVTVTDSPHTAANMVATLLEAGYDQKRIQLFNGEQTQMRVTNRPVVALVDEASPSTGAEDPPWSVVDPEATYGRSGLRASGVPKFSSLRTISSISLLPDITTP